MKGKATATLVRYGPYVWFSENGAPPGRHTSQIRRAVGVAVTGTGIPASTTITAIDPDNRTVTMSANATATGSVSVTGTYNDATIFYNVVTVNRPGAQGANS